MYKSCFFRLILFFICFTAQASGRYWFQLMPNNEMWFRYIEEKNETCPTITIEGKNYKLDKYSKKNEKFPLTCKISFKQDDLPKSFFLDGKEIKINFDKNNVKRIGIVGDTGCRSLSIVHQDCKNDWYFATIMDLIVKRKPDLIIHIGDYIYREKGNEDRWDVWKADFFDPAYASFKSNIPWVMVRGNHEECRRSGKGWFAFLSAKQSECENHTTMYNIEINNMNLIVSDSTLEEELLNDIEKINSNNYEKKVWLLTHRPLINYDRSGTQAIGYRKIFSRLNSNIEMVISGHLHALQLIELDNKYQLIVGNSGALLAAHLTGYGEFSKMEYGFGIIDFNENGMTITGYNKDDKQILHYAIPKINKCGLYS